MKQKLLNSFTWRGTLLVALLCTSFGNAWGQTKVTSTLTFNKSSKSYTANDGSTVWTASPTPSYSDGHLSNKNTFTLSTKSITGTVTSVVVKAARANGNFSPHSLQVNVGGTEVINTSDLTTNPTEYSYNDECYIEGTNNTIEVITKGASNKAIYLYSVTVTYIPKATFSINESCSYESNYYGTYSNKDWAFVVPSDLTISKIKVTSDKKNILSVASLSGIVPKKTGVLVSSNSYGPKSVFVSEKTATADVSDNMLVASSITMSEDDNDDYYFYHLTFDSSNPLGFYWGEKNGGAWNFSGGSNKAYLMVSKNNIDYSASVKGFTMSDTVDGIKAVETEKAESNAIYNLAGQRVSKMQKGLYIVNGKKMIQR